MTVGRVSLVCTPTISKIAITKTLIDGGIGLSVIPVKIFNKMQVLYEQLMPTRPFLGMTEGTTMPIGQVHLPVTVGSNKNYYTELIDCDAAHISLS